MMGPGVDGYMGRGVGPKTLGPKRVNDLFILVKKNPVLTLNPLVSPVAGRP